MAADAGKKPIPLFQHLVIISSRRSMLRGGPYVAVPFSMGRSPASRRAAWFRLRDQLRGIRRSV
jgi:hypothetical protein